MVWSIAVAHSGVKAPESTTCLRFGAFERLIGVDADCNPAEKSEPLVSDWCGLEQ